MKKFNKTIEKIGKIISIESKINVVGSANVKRSIYYSDYDLYEQVDDKSFGQLYSHFKSIYTIFDKTDNIIISDFKMGGMHWTQNDVINKIKNGVSFDDAIKMKSIIKLDIICLLNGRFIEISEVYRICFKNDCNMDYSKDEVIKNITNEYKEEIKDGNYMKGLKKTYSLMKLHDENDPKLNKLVDYFNSSIGLLYRTNSYLKTLLLAMEFKKFKLDDFTSSLEIIKETLSAFPVENNIDKIIKISTKNKMKLAIRKQITVLNNYINKNAKVFIRTFHI